MKKVLLLITVPFLCFQGTAQDKMNKVSVDPAKLFGTNVMNVEYERGFLNGQMGVSLYLGRTGNATRTLFDHMFYIAEQIVTIKRYTNNINLNSFWYGGQLSVTSGNIYDVANSKFTALNMGVLGISCKGGYQWIIKSFYLDLFGGLGIAVTKNLFGDAQFSDGKGSIFIFTLGIKTGIAF